MTEEREKRAPLKTKAIYEAIKEDVIRLRFRADEIINEKDLAERYGVSKTPVHEALGMLVQEGYLKKIPWVGYLLRELDRDEFGKMVYLRYTLERGVVLWIIGHCSDTEIDSLRDFCRDTDIAYRDFAGINYDFHIAMARLTNNEYLYSGVQNAFNRLIRVPSEGLFAEVQKQPHMYHLQLIDAMKARDKEKALELLRHECRRDDEADAFFE